MSQYKENDENFIWVLSALHDMIDETIYHAQTFSQALKLHHNDKAANIFFLAYEQFKTQKEIVVRHAQNIELKTIPPWETPFPEYQHPSSCLVHANYLMTEDEAWKTIVMMNMTHNTFYDFLLQEHNAEEVIKMVDLLMEHNEPLLPRC